MCITPPKSDDCSVKFGKIVKISEDLEDAEVVQFRQLQLSNRDGKWITQFKSGHYGGCYNVREHKSGINRLKHGGIQCIKRTIWISYRCFSVIRSQALFSPAAASNEEHRRSILKYIYDKCISIEWTCSMSTVDEWNDCDSRANALRREEFNTVGWAIKRTIKLWALNISQCTG